MMKTRRTGTLCPKKDTGGLLRRGMIALVVLLLACVLMAGTVSADNVAKIGNTEYATLYDAFNATVAGQETVITLLRDATGGGVVLQSGNTTVLDLNDHTFTIGNPTVGSSGTETNGFQLLKDSDITIKNGKITSSTAKILIQNYANLTLDNVELDGSQLDSGTPYTLSNNFGNIVLKGTTKIIAKTGGHAFDVCDFREYSGVSVTIADDTVMIDGNVEVTCDRSKSAYTNHNPCPQATLIVPYGYSLTIDNVDVKSNTYYWKATGNNMMQLTFTNAPIPVLNDSIVVSADGTKAMLLRDVTTTETITVDKKVTLDLNGHDISSSTTRTLFVNGDSADLTLMNSASTGGMISSSSNDQSPVALKKGILTLKSGIALSADSSGNGDGISILMTDSETDKAKITIEQGAVVTGPYGIYVYDQINGQPVSYGHDVTLNVYGTVQGIIFIGGNHLNTGTYPKVNVYDGAVINGGNEQGIAMQGVCLVTVYGGTISGNEAIGLKGGNLVIHDGTFDASGTYSNPAAAQSSGTENTGAAIALTNTYYGDRIASLTINGGTFTSTHGNAVMFEASEDKSGKILTHKGVTAFNIAGGTFKSLAQKPALWVNWTLLKDDTVKPNIIGGKYSVPMNESGQDLKLPTSYIIIDDNGCKTVAKEVPKASAEVTKDTTTGVTEIDIGTSQTIKKPAEATAVTSVDLKLKAGSEETGDIITLTPVTGKTLSVDGQGVVTGEIAVAVIKPQEIVNPNGQKTKLELTTTDIEKVFGGRYTLEITNEPTASDLGSTIPENIVAGISVKLDGFALSSAKLVFDNILAGSKTPQVWHAKAGQHTRVASTYSGNQVTTTVSEFSSYYVTLTAAAATSSSGSNMNNAFRVLFDTKGGSYVSPATGLSYGDKIAAPKNPTKDGYTFGGWYKDSACTQAWSFSDSIPGDMTLYAKWTSAAGAQAEATTTTTATATAKATTAPVATQSQSTSAATAAPASTTAAGSQPTLTQAPAPVLGALLGLLAAGVLLRRRD